MEDTYINVLEEPDLEDPVLIEGLPGIGNIGRLAAGYIVEELGAEKFAELYSHHFLPFVLLHDNNVAEILKNEFYYWKNSDGQDLIILMGDAQAGGDGGGEGHYAVAEKIMDFAEELGVQKIYTLGGFATGEIEEAEDVEVLGAVSDPELADRYSDMGIDFETTSSRIGMIVGATGLLIGMADKRDMEGVCLMGETTGFPILTDPRAAENVLESLLEMIDVDMDMTKMDKRVEEMEEFLERIEKMQQKAMQQMSSQQEGGGGEKLSYIG